MTTHEVLGGFPMRPLGRARPSLLRHLNERQVLAAIQSRGPQSRADIMRSTGISGPTVTRAVQTLLDAGLLEEGDFRHAGRGRPSKALRLAGTSVCVLGAVVGPARCEVVSSGLDGRIRPNRRAFDTPPTYPGLINAFASHIEKLAAEGKTTVLGLGVSIPGLLHGEEKRTVLSPNLHQTDGRQIGKDLADRTGLETVPMQEMDCLCLAERMYGHARNVEDFAMLDLSDGLGVGFVHKGQILEGHSGLAGELGHVTIQLDGRPCGCGNRGCLETVATDTALLHGISERLGRRLTMDEMLAGVRSGSIVPGPEFEEVLQYLAVGLAAAVNLFNPRMLFVYGRFFDADSGLFARLVELTKKRALGPSMAECEIIRAQIDKSQGAIAAVMHHITAGWEGAA
jgi:N-acetylglucosamine repressor